LISDDIRNIFKEILFSSKILKKKKIGNKKKNLTQQEEKKRTRTGAGALRFLLRAVILMTVIKSALHTVSTHSERSLFFSFFLKAADLFVELFFLFLSRRTRGSRDGRLYTTARCLQLIALHAFAYLITRSRAPCPQRSLNATRASQLYSQAEAKYYRSLYTYILKCSNVYHANHFRGGFQ
jgi:hypothetical protein